VLVVDASVLVVALADDGTDGDSARARLRGERLAIPEQQCALRRVGPLRPAAVPSPARYDDTVCAQPAEREGPLDLQRILDQLPQTSGPFVSCRLARMFRTCPATVRSGNTSRVAIAVGDPGRGADGVGGEKFLHGQPW